MTNPPITMNDVKEFGLDHVFDISKEKFSDGPLQGYPSLLIALTVVFGGSYLGFHLFEAPCQTYIRSLHTSPLKHQVVWLLETKLIVDAELGAESVDVQYISMPASRIAASWRAAASQRSVCATVYELSHCM